MTDLARVPAVANALAPVTSAPRVSVLVPAKDEAENLPEFMRQAAEAFAKTPGMYEVIVIDDGSVDDTPAVLARLEREYPFLRTVRHRFRRGIADALRTGYAHSRGEVLVFYPADLQFKPADIPTLVDPVLAGDVDIMTGRKEGDYEKAFVSGIYNRLSRSLFHVPVRDLNSVKAYRRDVMATVRAVATSSAPPIIGIQPCALPATRRRLSLELPPIQIGMGSWTGRGRAMTSRASKWRP